MNVAVICDVLGEPNNGTTIATLNFINSLKERGHNVSVVCPDQDKKELDNYFVVPHLDLGWILNRILKNNRVSLAKPDEDTIRAAVEPADVVHLQLPFALGRVGLKIARELGKPVTASFHCQAENFTSHIFLMNSKLANKITYRNFYKNVFSRVDKVHYPTAFIRDLFEAHTDKTKSVVISNGVNGEFFQKHPRKKISDKFTIVCTGRFSKEKAQWTLIEAAALSHHNDDLKIIFAGAGPLKENLHNLAQKLGVDCEFNFYSRQNLIEVLHGADLYVHTATVEIEAIACTEAIVSGLVPVICDSPKSATRAFALDQNNLFRINDAKSLAEKIDFWYENDELKQEYVAKYRSMAMDFDQNKCMDKMEKMLIEALNENNLKKACGAELKTADEL